jgi:hypothetical protein
MPKRGRKADASGRSIGTGRHVRLHHWMMVTPAWRTLTCPARALLVELYALFNGTNNGALFLSVRDAAERLAVSKSTAARSFDQLCERGFIRPHVRGAFSRKVRHATQWVLTEYEHCGQMPGKEFARWRPASENQNTVPLQGQTVPSEGQVQHAAQ